MTNAHKPTHDLAGKRLVILGLARQGTALARFACEQGADVVVSDLRSAENLTAPLADVADLPLTLVLGHHPDSLLDGADYIAISGSVPADAPLVQAARARGVTVTNDSFEFSVRCPAPIVGITGSAGKSTTTALVGAMGVAAGRTTWVGGNIGRPLIVDLAQMTTDDVVVQELSSFQLEIWTASPPVALITNITPNHLDRHKTMAIYTQAKANILRYQSAENSAILPAGELAYLEPLVNGRLRHFSMTDAVADGAFLRGDAFILRDGAREQVIGWHSDTPLRGAHNVKNVLAAIVAADAVGISAEAMRAAIRTFTGIEHRLEPVASVAGVQYVNDSIATAPERALAALHAFSEPLILLAGGRDKEMVWETWADTVAERVKTTILFGELADALGQRLASRSAPFVQVDTLAEAVATAHAMAQAGDVVLLSPGGTSFDAYVDFAARGVHFRQLVSQLPTLAERPLIGN